MLIQFYNEIARSIFILICPRLKGHNKRPHRVDVTKLPPQSESGDSNGPTPIKAARMAGVHDPHDPNISDHVVAVTSLKEKIANLQKLISQKDGQLLAKEKQVSICIPDSFPNFNKAYFI
jgi:hypothetical protein